jgi:hypothetical protein
MIYFWRPRILQCPVVMYSVECSTHPTAFFRFLHDRHFFYVVVPPSPTKDGISAVGGRFRFVEDDVVLSTFPT